MPSILPTFEYDIFISYRHNDNRSGWVTEFVSSLKEELATIIKVPVSVYFDSNLYDGLLETHNVDKSLEGKLKSLIFIPVLSQIYCDTNSFAWKHEFCAYNQASLTDALGRDIAVKSGNVSSRILPIHIHNLDQEDTLLIENELKSKLRSIDFTFRSPGVNRPLRKDDKRSENVNNLSYHDQLNKLANAVKEILSAIKNPAKPSDTKPIAKEYVQETPPDEKSLAVLPFTNLSQDPAQEYFADGITENILMQLSSLPQFRVISRTSVMRYKKTAKSAPEIAQELGVKFIVEGSAQAHKDKVRISVQLIDALKDQHVWSKIFVESMDDIFAIQNSVAEIVAKELNISINPQAKKINEIPTKSIEAYDLFLKGRHAYNQWGVDGYRTASEYFKRAIEKDPDFREAYSYLASSFSARMSWNGDLAPHEALKNIEPYLNEAWRRGPSDNDYLTKAFIEFFINKDFAAAEKLLSQAIELNPNNALALYTYGYVLNMMGRFAEAAQIVNDTRKIDPLTIGYFNQQSLCLYLMGRYQEAITLLKEALQLYPSVLRFYDYLGRIYLTMESYEMAVDSIMTGLRTSKIKPPSMVAYLAASYCRLNETDKAKELLEELVGRSSAHEKGVNIYLVYVFNSLGDISSARRWLDKAKETNDVDLIWWEVDPLLKNLRDELQMEKSVSPDFDAVEKYLTDLLEKEMPALDYHNINHLRDVLQSAMVIALREGVTEEETKLIRVAALLHDAGFIYSPKNHEEKGAAMTREILPSYGFNSQRVEIICNMILATRLPQSPQTKLEKILCDADLDYLGRDDFYEIAGKLFREMLAQGAVETEREWNLVQRTFLQSHRYHTDYSKSNRENAKSNRLQEISSKLATR